MKLLLAAAFALSLAACASNPQLPVQYATLKLLEGEHVTQEAVLDRVERVRALLEGASVGADAIYDAIGWDSLAPSDRLLVSRSEEHTSELQSRPHLVCRLLLEKKKLQIARGSWKLWNPCTRSCTVIAV